MNNCQHQKLSNGIRLVTEHIPYVSSVAIGVWINTGSQWENTENNGVSHLIEHLLFQGTKNRSAKEIAETIDSVGGQLNAFTSKEHTCFYIRILDKYLPLALEVLADMVRNPLFAEADIEKEKRVVIEEIKMYEDSPDELVHDYFAGCLWPSHPLGRPIAGKAEGIAKMTRQDILNYYNSHYGNQNIVISVAGNIVDCDLVQEILKNFGQEKMTSLQFPHLSWQPLEHFYVRSKKNEQVHLCLGTRAFKRTEEKERYALTVLENILGGGVSSRLFQKVREERGLVYTIYDYFTAYEHTGAFCVYAGTSPDNVVEVVDLIVRELRDVRENGVTEEELGRTKEQMKGSLVLGLESTNSRMSRLAKCELYYGKIIDLATVMEKIDAVSMEDILSAAEIFTADNLVFAAVGTIDDEALIKEKIALLGE